MANMEDRLIQLKGYTYQIWEYHRGHSELTIIARLNSEVEHGIRLTFTNVIYIQSPFEWIGDFSIAEDKELKSIINRTEYDVSSEKFPIEITKKLYSLYKVNLSQSEIYILGKIMNIEYDINLDRY